MLLVQEFHAFGAGVAWYCMLLVQELYGTVCFQYLSSTLLVQG